MNAIMEINKKDINISFNNFLLAFGISYNSMHPLRSSQIKKLKHLKKILDRHRNFKIH